MARAVVVSLALRERARRQSAAQTPDLAATGIERRARAARLKELVRLRVVRVARILEGRLEVPFDERLKLFRANEGGIRARDQQRMRTRGTSPSAGLEFEPRRA